jgi:hypothetical protein
VKKDATKTNEKASEINHPKDIKNEIKRAEKSALLFFTNIKMMILKFDDMKFIKARMPRRD